MMHLFTPSHRAVLGNTWGPMDPPSVSCHRSKKELAINFRFPLNSKGESLGVIGKKHLQMSPILKIQEMSPLLNLTVVTE